MTAITWALLVMYIALCAASLLHYFRPAIFYRLVSDATLRKDGRWDECDGEPMNQAAVEWDRRHGAL